MIWTDRKLLPLLQFCMDYLLTSVGRCAHLLEVNVTVSSSSVPLRWSSWSAFSGSCVCWLVLVVGSDEEFQVPHSRSPRLPKGWSDCFLHSDTGPAAHDSKRPGSSQDSHSKRWIASQQNVYLNDFFTSNRPDL